MNFKINDKIRIIWNSNEYSYEIWEECYIVKVSDFGFYDTSKTKWGECTYAWSVVDEDCILVEEAITPWMMVGASNENQEDADRDYIEDLNQFYIWIDKNWFYITENNYWKLMIWRYISIKKEGKIPEN